MTDTPRTDKKVAKSIGLRDADACGEYISLCRSLERELAEARKDAIRAAEVDAKVNRFLVERLAEARKDADELKRKINQVKE
jgi:hypothetical protein